MLLPVIGVLAGFAGGPAWQAPKPVHVGDVTVFRVDCFTEQRVVFPQAVQTFAMARANNFGSPGMAIRAWWDEEKLGLTGFRTMQPRQPLITDQSGAFYADDFPTSYSWAHTPKLRTGAGASENLVSDNLVSVDGSCTTFRSRTTYNTARGPIDTCGVQQMFGVLPYYREAYEPFYTGAWRRIESHEYRCFIDIFGSPNVDVPKRSRDGKTDLPNDPLIHFTDTGVHNISIPNYAGEARVIALTVTGRNAANAPLATIYLGDDDRFIGAVGGEVLDQTGNITYLVGGDRAGRADFTCWMLAAPINEDEAKEYAAKMFKHFGNLPSAR